MLDVKDWAGRGLVGYGSFNRVHQLSRETESRPNQDLRELALMLVAIRQAHVRAPLLSPAWSSRPSSANRTT